MVYYQHLEEDSDRVVKYEYVDGDLSKGNTSGNILPKTLDGTDGAHIGWYNLVLEGTDSSLNDWWNDIQVDK